MSNGVSQPPSPPTLEYSRYSRLGVVGRHKKKLIFLATCLAIAIPVYRNWTPLKHRILWLYWFNQAMAFRMPEKTVDLRIHDPANAKAAAAGDVNYRKWAGTGMVGGPPIVEYVPIPYRHLMGLDPRLKVTPAAGYPLAFMGVMKRPDGVHRMVFVSHTSGFGDEMLAGTRAFVLPLPKWTDSPPATAPPNQGLSFSGKMFAITRLRSGQLDSADPSHLIFEFVVGPTSILQAGKPIDWDAVTDSGIIDAHLQNDDSIHFQIRNFSGTSPNIRLGPSRLTRDGGAPGPWNSPYMNRPPTTTRPRPAR